MYKLIAILCVFSILKESYCYLPSSITPCSRNHPKLEDCIIRTVDKLRPRLANGEFGDNFHVPKIEPLELDIIKMNRGNDFKATFNNLRVSGPSNFVVEKLKANANDLSFDFTVLLPQLDFTGDYTLKLKLLLLDINGKGTMKGQLKSTRAIVKVRGFETEKNGLKAVQFERMSMKMQVSEFKVHLDNLFGGDNVLGQVGNNFINENSEIFLSEILPGLEKSLSKKFTDIANSILSTTSAEEMFPPK